MALIKKSTIYETTYGTGGVSFLAEKVGCSKSAIRNRLADMTMQEALDDIVRQKKERELSRAKKKKTIVVKDSGEKIQRAFNEISLTQDLNARRVASRGNVRFVRTGCASGYYDYGGRGSEC